MRTSGQISVQNCEPLQLIDNDKALWEFAESVQVSCLKVECRVQFMVIESFKPGQTDAVYARFHERGRLLPPGLDYVASWLSADQTKCFQLMRTDERNLFSVWIENWDDLTDFEIVELADAPA